MAKLIKSIDPLLQKQWDEVSAEEGEEARHDAATTLITIGAESEKEELEQPVLLRGGTFVQLCLVVGSYVRYTCNSCISVNIYPLEIKKRVLEPSRYC